MRGSPRPYAPHDAHPRVPHLPNPTDWDWAGALFAAVVAVAGLMLLGI